jgi:HEAT repeat protein
MRLTDDVDERVRYDATVALGILGDDRAIEPLRQMLLANDETRPAGMAFYRLGPRTVPVLKDVFNTGDEQARLVVVNVVGGFAKDFGDTDSIAILKVAAVDPDPLVRADAQFWLDEIANSSQELA